VRSGAGALTLSQSSLLQRINARLIRSCGTELLPGPAGGHQARWHEPLVCPCTQLTPAPGTRLLRSRFAWQVAERLHLALVNEQLAVVNELEERVLAAGSPDAIDTILATAEFVPHIWSDEAWRRDNLWVDTSVALGEGTHAAIYAASDGTSERLVAKVPTGGAACEALLKLEALKGVLVASVAPAATVPVAGWTRVEAPEGGGTRWAMLMPRFVGSALAELEERRDKDGVATHSRSVKLLSRACSVLAAAAASAAELHELGLTHGDCALRNLIATDKHTRPAWRILVADLDFLHVTDGARRRAPPPGEQDAPELRGLLGEPRTGPTPAGDAFRLGLATYEALLGWPVTALAHPALNRAIVARQLRRQAALAADGHELSAAERMAYHLPPLDELDGYPELREVVERSVAMRVEHRATARELADALGAVARDRAAAAQWLRMQERADDAIVELQERHDVMLTEWARDGDIYARDSDDEGSDDDDDDDSEGSAVEGSDRVSNSVSDGASDSGDDDDDDSASDASLASCAASAEAPAESKPSPGRRFSFRRFAARGAAAAKCGLSAAARLAARAPRAAVLAALAGLPAHQMRKPAAGLVFATTALRPF
jgi:hypothetical protein